MSALLQATLPLFLLQAGLVIVLSRLLGAAARRIGQPLVIAEIVAGILLGPSFLGWISPRVEAALFPATSMPLLGLASQIGLVLFMFLVGLELDPKMLKGRGRMSVAISHSSIVVPFVLGGLLVVHVYGDATLRPAGVRFWPFLLFFGAAMSITAFPVLARILVERRLLRTRIGAVTIACAAVDDVTAWCMLAFVVSVARAANLFDAVRTVGFAFGYIVFMIAVVRPALAGLATRSRLTLSQNVVAATLVLLLASSTMTELIGIHALFGAFLFGAVIPKTGGFAAAFAEKIEDVAVVFLLPLFFAFSGLRTQLGLLDSAHAWTTCGLVVLCACVGKFGGSAVVARLTGLSWREASAIGVLMNTRGLVELIALNIGLDLGVISPTLFTIMVVMALVTTFMTTPLLARIYPSAAGARELELAEAPSSTHDVGAAPAPRYTALVCVSSETAGPGLLTIGSAVAGAGSDRSRIYALRLVAPTTRASDLLDQRDSAADDPGARAEEDGVLKPTLDRARELAVTVRPLSFMSSAPAKDICDVADVKHADLVLLGWHKRVFGSTMLSGTVHQVMRAAAPTVGVFVDRGLSRVARILVPYLGSEHDQAALAIARRIAQSSGARVTILHVTDPEKGDASRLGVEEKMREEFRETDGEKHYDVELRVVSTTDRGKTVIDESGRGYDLLLIGMGKQWGLEHKSFGIQAEKILERSAISVLVVRRALEAKAARVVAGGGGETAGASDSAAGAGWPVAEPTDA